MDNALRVKVIQTLFRFIRNIACNAFGAEFCFTHLCRKFFNMHRGKHIFFYDAPGNKDCILIVIAVPRHEADQNVPSERKLTLIGCRAIRNDIACLDMLSDRHNRPLMITGILICPLIFEQRIINRFRFFFLRCIGINGYFLGRHKRYRSAPPSFYQYP